MGIWLTKSKVKIAGYWPKSFSAFLCSDRQSRFANKQKLSRPISSYLDRTDLAKKESILWRGGHQFLAVPAAISSVHWTDLVKFCYMVYGTSFSFGIQRAIPSVILSTQIANHNAGFVHLARSQTSSIYNTFYCMFFVTLGLRAVFRGIKARRQGGRVQQEPQTCTHGTGGGDQESMSTSRRCSPARGCRGTTARPPCGLYCFPASRIATPSQRDGR